MDVNAPVIVVIEEHIPIFSGVSSLRYSQSAQNVVGWSTKMYLVKYQELVDLAEGKLKVEDIAKPEHIALVTWSGSDVKTEMDYEFNDKIPFEEAHVNEVAHRMGHCTCGECFGICFDEYFDELKKEEK